MRRLLQRWGHLGFALATAAVWALPMAAWAGGADLSGTGEAPWIALRIGLAALVAWVAVVGWASRVRVEPRPRRLDLAQMTTFERLSWIAFAACATIVVGWLNAAATVDWTLLAGPLGRGRAGDWALVVGAVVLLLGALAGAAAAWRGARREWLSRRG